MKIDIPDEIMAEFKYMDSMLMIGDDLEQEFAEACLEDYRNTGE